MRCIRKGKGIKDAGPSGFDVRTAVRAELPFVRLDNHTALGTKDLLRAVSHGIE